MLYIKLAFFRRSLKESLIRASKDKSTGVKAYFYHLKRIKRGFIKKARSRLVHALHKTRQYESFAFLGDERKNLLDLSFKLFGLPLLLLAKHRFLYYKKAQRDSFLFTKFNSFYLQFLNFVRGHLRLFSRFFSTKAKFEALKLNPFTGLTAKEKENIINRMWPGVFDQLQNNDHIPK